MNITIREYTKNDIERMNEIWNEVVLDGIAFPQTECLDAESGADFFGAQPYCGVAEAIESAKTILWNGPAGVFEFDNFIGGSKAIADAIAKATANGAFSLIGGGDSVACINKFGMADQVSYISTGGGALLEAIEGKVLPGVAAIKGE